MKVCMNCKRGYDDSMSYCPLCGNQNLVYYPSTQAMPVKKSNFQFGKFFKDYFKSPKKAKMETIQRNDFGTALLMNGIVLVLSYLIVLSIEGGYGFKFLDIFLYGLYVRKGQQAAETAKYSYYMCSLTNRIPFMFSALFVMLFSLLLYGAGLVILVIVLLVDVVGVIEAKLNYGRMPSTFMDSFMLSLTSVVAIVFAVGLSALFTSLLAFHDGGSLISDFAGSLF